ncbi:MAG: leucine-rich repeat protein [Paludibacteraceae bacterium]
MKKPLHLSTQLFTTFLLLFLFAFPQVGRGQIFVEIFVKIDNTGDMSCWDANGTPITDLSTITNSDCHVQIEPITNNQPLTETMLGEISSFLYPIHDKITEINLANKYFDWTDPYTNQIRFERLALASFENLKTIFLPIIFGENEKETDFTLAFQDCQSLETIYGLSQYSNVVSWKNAFTRCYQLKQVTLSFSDSFDKDGLDETFRECSNLQYADLSGAPANKIQSLKGTFRDCKSLKYVYLPKDTTNGVNLDYTFAGCNFNTQQIIVPGNYAVSSSPAALWWEIDADDNKEVRCVGLHNIKGHHVITTGSVSRPTPFVTCGSGKNIEVSKNGETVYLLYYDPYTQFSSTSQTIADPAFNLSTPQDYALDINYSAISDVENDGYGTPVIVENPKLASPATFYLTIDNCANGSGVPNVVDILDSPSAISAKDVVIITDPTLVGSYIFTPSNVAGTNTSLIDINSAPVSYKSDTLKGSFHLTTDSTFALRDDSNTPIQVKISELPGEYYLVPDVSAATALKDNGSSSNLIVSKSTDLSAKLSGGKYYYHTDPDYGLCRVNGKPIESVGYTNPAGNIADIYYYPIPEDSIKLFMVGSDFIGDLAIAPKYDPSTPPYYYYIQGGVYKKSTAQNDRVSEPKWATQDYLICGIYNINKLENISSMVGTFKNCTNLVFGVDNGTTPAIAGSEGNFNSTNNARLKCTEAFYGVKSFKTFTNGKFVEEAIDLTMFKDIESLNATFRNGGTKVQFYTGGAGSIPTDPTTWSGAQDQAVDMQYAFCGHTGYQQGEVLYIPFKNILSLYLAFGGDCTSAGDKDIYSFTCNNSCTIGNICFNSVNQGASCHIQRAFDCNQGLTTLSDATLTNFKRFESVYSYSCKKNANGVYQLDETAKHYNRLTYTFAHCRNLDTIKTDWLVQPKGGGEVEFLYTFKKCINLRYADLSGIMDYTKSLDGTFDQCKNLETCILGKRTNSLSMSSTFWGNNSLKTVKCTATSSDNEIDLSGLTYITNLAQTFTNCTSFEQIKFADNNATDIALKSTFSGCTRLKKVDLTTLTPYLNNTKVVVYTANTHLIAPTSTESNASVFDNTFNGCTALQTVTFDANVSNANEIGMPQTFLGCTALQQVENLDAFKQLTDLNQTFSGCTALKGAAFYNGDDANHSVQHLYRTFLNCSTITKIDLSSISNTLRDDSNTDPTKLAFGQTFFGCAALDTVKFGEDTDLVKNSNLVSMCGTFYGCAKLTGLTKIDKFTNITNLSQTFSGCAALQDVSFIGNVVGSSSTIGLFETFKGCTSLKKIDLTNLTARLENQEGASFYQATNKSITQGTFEAFEGTFDGCTALDTVIFDGTNGNKNSIGMPGTFWGCTALRCVKNLTAFQNLKQLNYTFYGCGQLDSIEFYNLISDTISLAGTFIGCNALTEITLPFFVGNQHITQKRGFIRDASNQLVENIIESDLLAFGEWNAAQQKSSKTFHGCQKLKKVTFKGSDYDKLVNVDNLFHGLSNLDTVANFDKFHVLKDGSLENTFNGCSSLDSIKLSAKLSEASTSYSLNGTFYGCEELATIVNFDKLTQVSDLTSTFAGCAKLDTLYFGFDPKQVSKADGTFNGAKDNGKKYLDCAWDKHATWYTYTAPPYWDINFIFEDRSATKPEIVFDCDMFDVKPQLQASGDKVVEFVNIVKDGTAYTPDATNAYLVDPTGTDTCGTITATATQITDIKLTASGTYDFHYRTENSGKGHCNKQATITLTLGNSVKHEVSGTVCEDEDFLWNTGFGTQTIRLTPTNYNAPSVSPANPDNESWFKVAMYTNATTGKKSRKETYKYYKQVKNIAGNKCEESSTLTLTVRLLDTITTIVTVDTCVCPALSYKWMVENGAVITIDKSAFSGAATSSSWTRTDNQDGSVMFEHKGLDTSDPQSCNTVYQLVFEKPHTPIDIIQTITTTHCQEYAYQWDLTPDNPDDDEYLTFSGADFDPTSTAWKLSVGAINSPSHTYDTSKDNLILDSKRTQSAIVNEMVTYTFAVKLKNANTCVDTYTLILPVKLTHRNEQTATICEDANYEWRDNADKVITTLDKSDFGQCLDKSQYGKYQTLTHDPALDIEKMVVRTYTDKGRRFREEIYKYYAQRENCAGGECEISDSLILTVELVDIITTTVKDATCVCPGLAYQWMVENDAVITIDEAAFADNATSALWTRTDNPSGSVTFEHSGTINGHLCATVYQLIFDKPTKPINDEKADKSCESGLYKWDLGSSGATIELSGNDFVNEPTWTVAAFTSSGIYSAIKSADRTLKAQQPATEQITFTYKVTLHNNQTACEDTYTLDLTVQQTHREQTTAQVCANVEYELKNVWGAVVLTLGSSEYNMGDVAANPFSNAGSSGTFSKTTLPNGTQRYVVSKTGGTQYGCFEEYTLDLTVNPVYDERPGGTDAANATTGTVCQNENFVWNIAGDALVSAITLTYADYNQTATAFNSAGQQLQLEKTTKGTTQCYTYKGADKNTHCDRFYHLTLTVSPVIDQTLYSPYTDATQMAYCSDQTYVWNDGGFSYYLDSVQFYRPDGVYTDNGITIEQTTISATPWIVQFVATVPSGSCQAKYKLLLALDDRFAANLVLANTVTDAVCNGSSYVWNYGSDGSVTVSPADPDYPAFPVGGQIKRRVSVPGASGCNDYYYLDLTINPSDHRTMTIDAVCRDENYFSYTGFPINEIVDFDAADLPADVKTYTHTVAHDCDQMTITFNFKEPERCQGKIVEGLVINQYECWLLMVNHNQLPLRDQEPVAYQWYVCQNSAPGDPNFLRNSNPIEGATKDFYTETQTLTGGYYWVKVTYIVGDEEFYYRSEPAALLCPDALEVVTTTDVMLSPNPVKQGSVVLIDGDALDVSAGAHIDVYTTAGQRVLSFDIATSAFKADVPAGCYLVQISVDRQTIVTAKMVVQ